MTTQKVAKMLLNFKPFFFLYSIACKIVGNFFPWLGIEPGPDPVQNKAMLVKGSEFKQEYCYCGVDQCQTKRAIILPQCQNQCWMSKFC